MHYIYTKKNIAGWLKQDISLTYEDFLQWWEKHFLTKLDMQKEFGDWKRSTNYMNPNKASDAPYTQQIAYWFHKNRDDYMITVVDNALSKHQKVLVVFGSNHLRDLWSQLIKTYGQPNVREFIPNSDLLNN